MISGLAALITFIVFMTIAIHFIRKAYDWMIVTLFRGVVRRRGRRHVIIL